MKVDRLDPVTPTSAPAVPKPAVVATIGSFDGVHRGHQLLIGQMVEQARQLDVESLVVTFDPLPAEVLQPGSQMTELTDIHERLDLLRQLDVDRVAVLNFTRTLSLLGPRAFLDVLGRNYELRELCVGADFAFGHKRQGDVGFLRRAGSEMGFGVHVVPREDLDGEIIASSRIRSLVSSGAVSHAAVLLGHYPTVSGTVERGAGRGRALGYPTANLSLSRRHIVPASGIYAGHARVSSMSHRAALSVGHNPTFGVNPLSVEAYILDFDRDIYAERITLEFVERLRAEISFESVEDLISQMALDVEKTREILDAADQTRGKRFGRLEDPQPA